MELIEDIKDHEPYPKKYEGIFQQVWSDPDVQKAVIVGRQIGLPEKYA